MYEDRIQWITHNGKRILYLDFSNLAPGQIPPMLAEASVIEKNEPAGSILGLDNFENLHFNVSVLNAFNKDIKENSGQYKATACLGVTGLVKVMFDTATKLTKQEMKCFSNKTEALDWLATK